MDRPKLSPELDSIRSRHVAKCMEEIECLEGSVPPAALRMIKDSIKKYLYYAVRDAGKASGASDLGD